MKIPVYDTRCNLNFNKSGQAKCHSGTDDVITPWGDTAVVSDPEQKMVQKILLWMTTKLGERFDPKLGCVLYEYMFGSFDGSTLKRMEFDLKYNLKYNFPEYIWTSITIQRTISDFDTEALAIFAIVNHTQFSFVVDGPSLLAYYLEARKTLKNSGLLDISKQYGF
jgi:hypothetical protein